MAKTKKRSKRSKSANKRSAAEQDVEDAIHRIPQTEQELDARTNRKVAQILREYRARIHAGKDPVIDQEAKELNLDEDACITLLLGATEIEFLHTKFNTDRKARRYLSRRMFREVTGVADKTWTKHFGTYEEFLKQAGLRQPRNVHRLERQIAKHKSVDQWRAIGRERKKMANKYPYLRNKRWQKVLVAADFHDIHTDRFALRVFLDAARRLQPDLVILDGDVFDNTEFGRYSIDPRDWGITRRIKFVHEKILGPLREACPKAQIDFIEGNHEGWLMRHMADGSQTIRVVLDELHGFTVEKLLGIDEFKINYVAKADLSAWTKAYQTKELKRNCKVYWETFVAHHFTQDGLKLGLPGVSGHSHRKEVVTKRNQWGAYQWHQIGCMRVRDANFTDAENWWNSFVIAYVDTENHQVNFEDVDITDFAVVGGEYYYRWESEAVPT